MVFWKTVPKSIIIMMMIIIIIIITTTIVLGTYFGKTKRIISLRQIETIKV